MERLAAFRIKSLADIHAMKTSEEDSMRNITLTLAAVAAAAFAFAAIPASAEDAVVIKTDHPHHWHHHHHHHDDGAALIIKKN
jgi:hypothetical protein